MTDAARERVGLLASLTLHGLLALLLLLVAVDIKPFQLDFTQISFSAAGAGQPPAGEAARAFVGEEPLIELPRRPMLDETSPLLKLPEKSRQTAEPAPPQERLEPPNLEIVAPHPRLSLEPQIPGVRERADIKPLEIGSDLLESGPPDLLGQALTGDEMFSLSWEGTPRTKLTGDLPKFPPGVSRGVKVEISFTVAPDGSVIYVAPATKGLPQMEKAAMDALRGWRFNALESSQPQVNQKGLATFIFQLK